jgi:Tfp pilus assembly protein PilV
MVPDTKRETEDIIGKIIKYGRWKQVMKSEGGSSLIEVIVAFALLGIIGVAFLSALATVCDSRSISNEHTAARILATSQMDSIREQTYAPSYDSIQVPPEYEGYTIGVNIDNFYNGNIQKIMVTIRHHNKDITKLESYKTIR